jgi:hypothetical protein
MAVLLKDIDGLFWRFREVHFLKKFELIVAETAHA